jgi:hypothetical protein
MYYKTFAKPKIMLRRRQPLPEPVLFAHGTSDEKIGKSGWGSQSVGSSSPVRFLTGLLERAFVSPQRKTKNSLAAAYRRYLYTCGNESGRLQFNISP